MPEWTASPRNIVCAGHVPAISNPASAAGNSKFLICPPGPKIGPILFRRRRILGGGMNNHRFIVRPQLQLTPDFFRLLMKEALVDKVARRRFESEQVIVLRHKINGNIVVILTL